MTFIFLLLSFLSPTPDTSKPLYKAVYTTQIITTAPISFEDKPTINSQDTFLHSFAKDILSGMGRKGFRFFFQDSIIAYKDSAVICTKSIADQTSPGINMNINLTDTLVYYQKGKFFTLHPGTGVHYFSEGSYSEFYATGKKETIKGYLTNIFMTADSTQTIWVTEKLPTLLNPRVRIRNPKGAILRYQWKKGKDVVISEIERIEQVKKQERSNRKHA